MKSLCSSGTCAGPLEDGEMKDGVPTPFACWFLLSSLCSLSWTSSSWFKYGIPSGDTTSHSLTSGPVNEGAAVALRPPRSSDAMAPDVNTDWRSHPGVMGQKERGNSPVLTITEHLVEVKSLTGQEINTGTLKQQEKKRGFHFHHSLRRRQKCQFHNRNNHCLHTKPFHTEATQTYLTDELQVRGRPVERFREHVKIKRLYDVPAETGIQDDGG